MAHSEIEYCVFGDPGNPCCSEPCQNRGVCTPIGTETYECDCTQTGYTGPNCTNRKYEWNTGETNFVELVFLFFLIFIFSSLPFQPSSSPGWKCRWSRRPTLSTTYSPTSRVSGTSSTTSPSSGTPSWDTFWLVSFQPAYWFFGRFQRRINTIKVFLCLLFSSVTFDREPPNFQRWLWLQKLGGLFQPFLLHTHSSPCVKRLPNAYGSSRWVLLRTSFLRFFGSV